MGLNGKKYAYLPAMQAFNLLPCSHLRQKVVQVALFPCLKKTVMADLRLSARCTGCRLQCVKKAASSIAWEESPSWGEWAVMALSGHWVTWNQKGLRHLSRLKAIGRLVPMNSPFRQAHLELLSPQLAAQRDVVLLADGHELLDIIDLLPALDDGQRDDVQHAREGLRMRKAVEDSCESVKVHAMTSNYTVTVAATIGHALLQ